MANGIYYVDDYSGTDYAKITAAVRPVDSNSSSSGTFSWRVSLQ